MAKKKKSSQTRAESIDIKRYVDGNFVLPAVVDVHNFVEHCWLDIIQLKGEQFKAGTNIRFGLLNLQVVSKLKDYPIQTESKIEDRLSIRKVRYFCSKVVV